MNREKDHSASSDTRERIAKWVIWAGIGGMVGLAAAMLCIAYFTNVKGNNPVTEADKVFTMLAPLFSNWIGTVLAYYFSGENFERANQSVRQLVEQVTEQRLRAIPIK